MALILRHGRHALDGVHRHDEQDGGDDGAAHRLDHAEDGGVDHRGAPQGQDEEGDDEDLDLLVVRLLAGLAQVLDDHPLQAFTGTQVVAEEGGDDGHERHQRTEVGDDGA